MIPVTSNLLLSPPIMVNANSMSSLFGYNERKLIACHIIFYSQAVVFASSLFSRIYCIIHLHLYLNPCKGYELMTSYST